MKYTFTIKTNDKTIEVDSESLRINGKLVSFGEADLSKPTVCKLYAGLLAQVKATPKGYFKGLSFPKLVQALQDITATDRVLRTLRMLNSEGGRDTMEAKINGEVIQAVGTAINFNWDTTKRFTDCERAVLSVVSRYAPAERPARRYSDPASENSYQPHYVGNTLDTGDLENLYKPVQDDDQAIYSKVSEFKSYDFTKYIKATDTKQIITDLNGHFAVVKQSIETFRKMRAIAGNDVVNWGDHKWASQVKRAGLESSYAAKHWLLDNVRKSLLESGVKPTEKKLSKAQLLKAELDKPDAEVSQADLVTLFKNASPGTCKDYVAQMDAATSVSMLSLTTKNVIEKIGSQNEYRKEFDAGPALPYIVSNVAESSNPAEFKTLLKFLRDNNAIKLATWQLFTNHVGHFSLSDFRTFAKSSAWTGPEGGITDEFYTQVLSSIPASERYSINTFITDAFLQRVATDADKIEVINNFIETDRTVSISWAMSYAAFQNLPYGEIRDLFFYENMRGEDSVRDEYQYFIPQIVQNQDTEAARAILLQKITCGRDDDSKNHYPLFSLFSFDDKVSILDETKSSVVQIKKVFGEAELNRFGQIVLTKQKLSQYVTQLPLKALNETVKIADVVTRVREDRFYMPLNEKIVKALSADSARRILARAKVVGASESTWSTVSDSELIGLKTKLYAKLDRDSINEAVQGSIADHSDRIALAQHMTQDEIVEACERDPKTFLRTHLDKVPVSYLEQFRDKDAFKRIVEDRRNRDNDAFGKALELKLAS